MFVFDNVRATSPMNSVALAVAVFLATAAGVVSCAPNPQRDSHCSPDSPSIAVDPDCIYAGKGKGPSFKEPACPAPEGNKPANCAATFDALVEMMTDSKRGNCTATACHGDPNAAASGIFFDAGDLQAFYDELTSVTGTVGTPYVVADDPSTADNEALGSWMQCNVVAEQGGGYPMPTWSGLMNPADATVVDHWILCGAPGPQ